MSFSACRSEEIITIHFYESCKKIVDARREFDEMSHRTVVSRNSILFAFVDCLLVYNLIYSFIEMRFDGFEPDTTTLVILFSAFSELDHLELDCAPSFYPSLPVRVRELSLPWHLWLLSCLFMCVCSCMFEFEIYMCHVFVCFSFLFSS